VPGVHGGMNLATTRGWSWRPTAGGFFLARDVDAVFMDLDDVERLDACTRSGADQFVVHDLAVEDVADRRVVNRLARRIGHLRA
jgi:hypothetical protein